MTDFRDTATLEYRVVGAGAIQKANQQLINATGAVDRQTKTLSNTMRNFGRNVQWTGQRVTFSLGLPLAAFGKSAVDIFLEVDRAFTQLRRVWDGNGADLDALKKKAVDLSNTFGIAQTEILGLETEFAKLGVQSVQDIGKLTEISLKTAAVFDVDVTKAFDGVKSAFKGFNFTADQTEKAMAAINIIADKTAADEAGILDFLSIMSGLARQSGLSINDLGAATAVFSQNAISASEGANALKFIIQRIQTPTDKAASIMREFGVNLADTSFKTLNARQQIEVLAKKFLTVQQSGSKLELAEFRSALSELVGKRQLNRFLVLLEDMSKEFDNNVDSQSEYFKALQVSADETNNMLVLNEQVKTQLESSASKWDQLKEKINNSKEAIGARLIPILEQLLPKFLAILDWFNSLDPRWQDWIIKIGLALVALGPFLIVLGSTLEVFGFLLGAIKGTIAVMGAPLLGVLAAAAGAYLLVRDAVNDYRKALDDADKSAEDLHTTQMSSIKKAAELRKQGKNAETDFLLRQVRNNPIGGHHGLLVDGYRHGGVIPGSSALRDRVPLMAEPGEGIMSKQAIENFLRTGQVNQNSQPITLNLNVGTMIATPGEQREFVRKIKLLLAQDEMRIAGVR